MKKTIKILVITNVISILAGMAIAIAMIANGVHLSIPRIEINWSAWTDDYDLELNVAQDSEEPRGSIEAVASK